jgi:DNA-binding LacI/PurR family transcriptional regulator
LSWWEARQRRAGWATTLVSHGLDPDDCAVHEGDWTVSSGADAFAAMRATCPDMDAVFASNDQMALGVLHAAHNLGLRVPDDLAVVGVDNTAESSHFWPPLTTVDQPLGRAGELAVEAIDELISASGRVRRAAEIAPKTTLLDPRLIVRESSRMLPLDTPGRRDGVVPELVPVDGE